MSFGRLGRLLSALSAARQAATQTRRDDILRQTTKNLAAEIKHAINDAKPLPKAFASAVPIQEGDKDYFAQTITDDHLADLFGINPTQYHVRGTVYNQMNCGQPQYAFQVAILRRK